MSTSLPQESEPRPRIPLRHVLAVFAGNGLEFYDFLTFSFFAVYISRTFFPGGNPATALLATLATFGAGFLTRPIGAIVIGRMGDRKGRKPAMLLSFALMGVGIVGLSLTPSYAMIGHFAPPLVLLFRLVQGFALGGEVGPSTAYMAEAAPPERRGLYVAMQSVTQDVAVLVAGIVGTAMAAWLSPQQLQDWGWRAAMLLGAAIVPFGLYVRNALPETFSRADAHATPASAPAAAPAPAAHAPTPSPAGGQTLRKLVVLGLMMLTAGTIASYTLNYMTTYALDTLHLGATISFSLIIVNGLLSVVCEATAGWLSDRYGRKPVMIVPGVLLVLAIFPCFWLIDHVRTVAALYGAYSVMVILAGLSSVPVIVTITESLPVRIRAGGVAIIYAFAISIFGGSTQFVIKLLITKTGNPLAPAYYWTAAAILGLVARFLVQESAPGRQRRAPGGGAPETARG